MLATGGYGAKPNGATAQKPHRTVIDVRERGRLSVGGNVELEKPAKRGLVEKPQRARCAINDNDASTHQWAKAGVGSRSFVDDEVELALDRVQREASVITRFIHCICRDKLNSRRFLRKRMMLQPV